jgi:periplasmic protein TonB
MKKKTKRADLEGKKFLFFEIGIIVALALALAAFEWQSKANSSFYLPISNVDDLPYDEIPITRPDKIVPPPPPVPSFPDIIKIHDNESHILEDPDIFIDIDEGTYAQIAYIITEEEEVDEPIPFMLIEDKPTFMGGDYNTFTQWVFQHLRYPEQAQRNGIQGKVLLEFTIDIDGSVSDVRVARSVDPLLDKEAVRVVSSSPRWSPGRQRGKATPVVFTFPVSFRLSN